MGQLDSLIDWEQAFGAWPTGHELVASRSARQSAVPGYGASHALRMCDRWHRCNCGRLHRDFVGVVLTVEASRRSRRGAGRTRNALYMALSLFALSAILLFLLCRAYSFVIDAAHGFHLHGRVRLILTIFCGRHWVCEAIAGFHHRKAGAIMALMTRPYRASTAAFFDAISRLAFPEGPNTTETHDFSQRCGRRRVRLALRHGSDSLMLTCYVTENERLSKTMIRKDCSELSSPCWELTFVGHFIIRAMSNQNPLERSTEESCACILFSQRCNRWTTVA